MSAPAPGWSPSQIVQNFLLASADFADHHAIAREYLTGSASRSWQPGPGLAVTVIAQPPRVLPYRRPFGSQNTAVVEITREGAGPGQDQRAVHPGGRRPGAAEPGVHPAAGEPAMADRHPARRGRDPAVQRAPAHQGPVPAGLPAPQPLLPGFGRQGPGGPGARPGLRAGRFVGSGRRSGPGAAGQPGGLARGGGTVRVPAGGLAGAGPPCAGPAGEQDRRSRPEPAQVRDHPAVARPDGVAAGLDADQLVLRIGGHPGGQAGGQRPPVGSGRRGQPGAEPPQLPAARARAARARGPVLPGQQRRGARPRPGRQQRRAGAGGNRPGLPERHRGVAGPALPGGGRGARRSTPVPWPMRRSRTPACPRGPCRPG